MSEAVDLAALAARGVNHVTLARGVEGESGHGTDYTGWSDASSVFVAAKVGLREQSRGVARIVLTVEGSSNGSVWSTLATFTFGSDGSDSATIDSPPNHLRVSWAITGGSEWMIFYVDASASVVDAPASPGGSQPLGSAVTLDATDPDLTNGTGVVIGTIPAGSWFLGYVCYIVAAAEGDPFPNATLHFSVDDAGGDVLNVSDADLAYLQTGTKAKTAQEVLDGGTYAAESFDVAAWLSPEAGENTAGEALISLVAWTPA